MSNETTLQQKIKEIADYHFRATDINVTKLEIEIILTTALKDKSLLLMALKELEGESEPDYKWFKIEKGCKMPEHNTDIWLLTYSTPFQDRFHMEHDRFIKLYEGCYWTNQSEGYPLPLPSLKQTSLSPEQKAKELFDTIKQELYFSHGRAYSNEVKAVVKITIQEIMKAEEAMWDTAHKNLLASGKDFLWISYQETPFYTYWQEVLTHLDKL